MSSEKFCTSLIFIYNPIGHQFYSDITLYVFIHNYLAPSAPHNIKVCRSIFSRIGANVYSFGYLTFTLM